jgi:hypothetical protein
MPQAMQCAEDDTPQNGAVALLQPRQCESAPAQLFRERPGQDDEHGLWKEHGEQERPLRQERQGQVHPKKDAIAHKVHQEKTEDGDQVPVDTHSPLHTSAQELSHPCFARRDGRHGEGCQGRPGKGTEDKSRKERAIWEREGEETKPIHPSGKYEGQEEGPGPPMAMTK